MTTQSIVCGSCAAAVPYGRLSCPSCGELLASVAGGRRMVAGAVMPSATRVSLREGSAAEVVAGAHADAAEVAEGDPGAGAVGAARIAEAPLAGDAPASAGGPERPLTPWRSEPSVLMGVESSPWTSGDGSAASVAMPPSAPGAYVPPSAPLAVAAAPALRPAAVAIPAGPPAPARAWAGHGAGTAAGEARATADGTRAADGTSAAEPADTEALNRLAEFVRWLAVAGSSLAAVGFILPLASSVIGATGVGYLDRAGLAGPGHILVVAVLLGMLAALLAGDRIPLWIRIGLPGVGFGALLIGLVWPYVLVDALRAGPGAYAILAGALLLLTAGLATLVADRQGRLDPPA